MSAELRLLLRDLRQSQDLSQDELARQLGISRQSVISLEQGAYLPSFPLLINMIHFFNCSLDELVEGAPRLVRQVISGNEEGGERVKMQTTRFDPFQAIDSLHDDMSEIFERNFGRVNWPSAVGAMTGAMNIHESNTDYTVSFQVPGFKEGEIVVELADSVLTVSGEHKAEAKEGDKNLVRREWEHSSFSRLIRFAHPIIETGIEAKLSDGLLIILAPKVEPVKPTVKTIEVKK